MGQPAHSWGPSGPCFWRATATITGMRAAAREYLQPETVADYLRDRGILGDERARASFLGGGVSNVVLLVESDSRRLVVKQALPTLRVAEQWTRSSSERLPRRALSG